MLQLWVGGKLGGKVNFLSHEQRWFVCLDNTKRTTACYKMGDKGKRGTKGWELKLSDSKPRS